MASFEFSHANLSRLTTSPKLLIIRSLTDYSGLINSSFDPMTAFRHPRSTVSRLEPETPGLREQRCLGDRRRIPARVDSSLGLHFFNRTIQAFEPLSPAIQLIINSLVKFDRLCLRRM